MKKICMITTVSLTMKTFVLETAKYLYENCGYDITLICNNDEEFKKSLPEYIRFIPVRMNRGIDFYGFKSVSDFIRIFRKEKFDLVQYATPNASCYASIAAKLCRVPIRLYCQWGIRYVGLTGVSRKIFKFIEKMICGLSTDIRAVSHMNRAFAVAEGLYKTEKAIVVGNGGTIGVDMEKYCISKKEAKGSEIRNKYGITDNEFVFGFSGRVSADKGCEELLTAFKNLTEENKDIKLMLVGPLEDNCGIKEELIEWAKNSDKVISTGMIDVNDMAMYYSAMNALVHPTYREGFGMVLQEAGALGLGIITTKIPGASEVMEDGVSCILVEPKCAEELKQAMNILAVDREKNEALGNAAYERTAKYYDRKIMLEKQKKEYEALLER